MTDDDAMLAIRQSRLGGPEVLEEVRVPRPRPGIGEVLVAVRATSLNPTDLKNRTRVLTVDRLPLILGWDVSGVVDSVGPGVTLWKPGDEVFGMLPYPRGVGAHAQYVAGPARAFVSKPAGLTHVEAGALPLAALTSHQALVDTAHVTAGARVLVHAAAGGVGHLAVQIAKSLGAHVIGTASSSKVEFARQCGADEVIDYRAVDFTDVVSDVDVVFDTVGGDTTSRSLDVLRPGGTLVSLIGLAPEVLAEARRRGVRSEFLIVEADHRGMTAIADLVRAGALRVEVAATFPLRDAAIAHARAEEGGVPGKVVMTVEP